MYIVATNNVRLYRHMWKLGEREIVWKHGTRSAESFRTISIVDLAEYQYGKNPSIQKKSL